MQRTSWDAKSRCNAMIRVGNSSAESLRTSVQMRGFFASTLNQESHIRMELQKELIKRLLLVPPHFLFRRSSHLLSGHLQLQPMCTQQTGPPLQLSMERHPISIGKARNQTSLISECLDVLPMFWFANLKEKHLNPTLGNAYSLGILRG